MLPKPTAQTPHGGGFRFAVGSLEYRTILEWIKNGATYDSPGSPRIASLKVFPEDRLLTASERPSNSSPRPRTPTARVRDVTHLVQYTSNDPDTVQVHADGEVKALQTGETAVMVRTLGQARGARSKSPPAQPALQTIRDRARDNYIDEHVFAKLEAAEHPAVGDSRAMASSCGASISTRSACCPRQPRAASS